MYYLVCILLEVEIPFYNLLKTYHYYRVSSLSNKILMNGGIEMVKTLLLSLNKPGLESWLHCSPAVNLLLTSVILSSLFSNMCITYFITLWDKMCKVPDHNQAWYKYLNTSYPLLLPIPILLYLIHNVCLGQILTLPPFLFPSGDSSHKIPISHFESGHDQATVLQNLYRFIHPNPGNWPPIYCKVIST